MNLPIQYEGFVISGASRVYNFVVPDVHQGIRLFSVNIPSESFRSTHLKFQDGPAISYERVKQELTGELPAHAQLQIGDQDIAEYLERHYPRKHR